MQPSTLRILDKRAPFAITCIPSTPARPGMAGQTPTAWVRRCPRFKALPLPRPRLSAPSTLVRAIHRPGASNKAMHASTGPAPPSPPAATAPTTRVAWEARAPAAPPGQPDAAPGMRLWEQLQALHPQLYPSARAAKKAVRRREIRVDGAAPADPSMLLTGGELLQCVQRLGALSLAPSPPPRNFGPPSGPAGGSGSGVDSGPGGRAGASNSSGSAVPPLEVLYEDDHMACIVKPQGVPCDTPPGRGAGSAPSAAGASGQDAGSSGAAPACAAGEHSQPQPPSRQPPPAQPSVYSRLPASLQPSPLLGVLRRPRHCHRLDEPTGGLLLVGKTRQAHAALSSAFADRQVQKRYRALAWGRLEGRGRITWELDGRPCDTEYAAVQHTPAAALSVGGAACQEGGQGAAAAETEAAGQAAAGAADARAAAEAEAAAAQPPQPAAAVAQETAAGQHSGFWVTTVDLWPHTGRKHQLRKHMALLGHPLVGEPRYTFGYAAQREAAGRSMPADGHQRLPEGQQTQQQEAEGGAAALSAEEQAGAVAEEQAGPGPAEPPASAAPGLSLPRLAAAANAAHGLPLCLWAVELRLERHPSTGEPLDLLLPEPPLFEEVRAVLAGHGGPTV